MEVGVLEKFDEKKLKSGGVVGVGVDSLLSDLDLWEVEFEFVPERILARLKLELLVAAGRVKVENNAQK